MRTKKSVLKKTAALFLAVIMTAAVAITAPVEVEAASNRTAIGLAEFGLEAYRDGWRYNYGSYGQLNSKGQRISDCSGLIFAYLCWNNSKNGPVADYSWPRGATAQYKYCYETGTGAIPRTHGILLFHRTSPNNCEHVGIYVGNDKSVDNSSYGANMRYMTASTYSKWTAWGKLKNIEYPTNGWYKFDGDPYYYVDGQYVINKTLTIDGESYTFGSDGIPSPRPSNFSEGDGNVTDGEKMITTAGVNVRKTASLDGNIIRSIAQGTTVYVTDKSNDEWYKVKLTDGTKGYIFSQYLSDDGKPNENTDDTSQTGKTTTALNLRSEANTNSTIKLTLPKGTSLVITKKLDGWYKVKLSDGTTGYVASQYVSLSGDNNNSGELNIKAETTACVNVRKTASTNAPILKVIDSGTQVTITERTNSSWYKVKLSDGTKGYIYASYLKETSSGGNNNNDDKSCNITAKTTANVNLRKKASTSSAIIKTVKKNTKLTIIEKTNSNWYRVKLSGGTKGYMSSKYLKEVKETTTTTTTTTSNNKTATTTTGVNLRAEASTSANIKCVVLSGTKVTITNTSSKEWLGVKLSDGTKGYISAKYLKLNLSGKTTTAVNLRASDSTDSAIKKVVSSGTKITITAMPSPEWFKVKLSDGTTGYIASDYISY